jgi:formylglycine-generating enzyme
LVKWALLPVNPQQQNAATERRGHDVFIMPSSLFLYGVAMKRLFALLMIACTSTALADVCNQNKMVAVPAGDFLMGNDHAVYLDAFFIDRFEITVQEYVEFLNTVGNQEEGGEPWWEEYRSSQIHKKNDKFYFDRRIKNFPVVYVTWYGAQAYCRWKGKRLPTEAEWEKAARGTDGRVYPWGFEWDPTKANWRERGEVDGYLRLAPVTAFPHGASPYGAYNMAGNVWEWVADWYSVVYYSNPPELNPRGPEDGKYKVHKGGCFIYPKEDATGVSRIAGRPVDSYPCVGFRCACDYNEAN